MLYEVITALNRIMTAPRNNKEHQLQNAFNSIGPPVEILELLEVESGVALKLFYTVYDPFTIDGPDESVTWQAGDQLEMSVELANIDNRNNFV